MFARKIREDEVLAYNKIAQHPLQLWQWGNFRQQYGNEVVRIGFFDKEKILQVLQVTFHQIPHTHYTVGYLPKSSIPNTEQIETLKLIAKEQNAIFIKMEPNYFINHNDASATKLDELRNWLTQNNCQPGRPLFTRFSFVLDLKPEENILFSNLHSKTRYNIRLAIKKGVTIIEDSSANGLETYLQILQETTKRQQFYAHNEQYFRQMWQNLMPTGVMKIFHAVYEQKTLASWIIFLHNNTLYYPYGASSNENREVMASNLLMWEVIRFGKAQKCTSFDMWGALGENPDPKNPWFGFHKFKQGYGGQLVEFIGTYDLVINYPLYQVFTFIEKLRWFFLRLKAKIH